MHLELVVDDPSGNAVLLHFLLYFLMRQKTPHLHELAIRQFEDAIKEMQIN